MFGHSSKKLLLWHGWNSNFSLFLKIPLFCPKMWCPVPQGGQRRKICVPKESLYIGSSFEATNSKTKKNFCWVCAWYFMSEPVKTEFEVNVTFAIFHGLLSNFAYFSTNIESRQKKTHWPGSSLEAITPLKCFNFYKVVKKGSILSKNTLNFFF